MKHVYSKMWLATFLAISFSSSFATTETSTDTETTPPPPTAQDIISTIQCVVMPEELTNVAEFASAGVYDQSFDRIKVGANDVSVSSLQRVEQAAVFRAFCRRSGSDTSNLDVTLRWVLKSGFSSACTSSPSGGICTDFTKTPVTRIGGSEYREAAAIVLRNVTSEAIVIQPSDVTLEIEYQTGSQTGTLQRQLAASVTISGMPPPKCQIFVSGAVNPTGAFSVPCGGTCDPPLTEVMNGSLVFRAMMTSGAGLDIDPTNVTWTSMPGGITAQGLWENPPDQVSFVKATVTGRHGTASCAVNVQPQGERFVVSLTNHQSCTFFQAARDYYFYDDPPAGSPEGTPMTIRTRGYAPPISYLGLDGVTFGAPYLAPHDPPFPNGRPEIPFMGVMNVVATRFIGDVDSGPSGQFLWPPLPQRDYSSAVIVAYVYRPGGGSTLNLGPPIYYAKLDPNNYAKPQLAKVPGAEEPGPDDLVVFQAYLAHKQTNGNRLVDVRGNAGQIPTYRFTPGDGNGTPVAGGQTGHPFDKPIPFFDDSCPLSFLMSVPKRADKPRLPDGLASATMCMMSKAFRFADFRSGRVGPLKILGMAPQGAVQNLGSADEPKYVNMFPLSLLRESQPPAFTAEDPSDLADLVPCWNLSASSRLPRQQTTNTSNAACFQGGWPAGACPVIERADECTSALAYRAAPVQMYALGALGCAVKYDGDTSVGPTTSGMKVVSHFTANTNYRNVDPGTWHFGESPRGYGCTVCWFASVAARHGTALSSGYSHTFTKSFAPRKAVRTTRFSTRHWGSRLCDIDQSSASGYCGYAAGGANWISNTSCPNSNESISTETIDGNNIRFKSSRNVFGDFTADMCPDSAPRYSDVSASWSPLVLDIAGTGIRVSRESGRAVTFDIKGDGKAIPIDWLDDPSSVAFLVRPVDGKVRSVRELFGADKTKNGFEALKKLDSNRDDKIDARDKRFKDLALWFDRNRDGKSDPGEIEPLDGHGVLEISLRYYKPVKTGDESRMLQSVYFSGTKKRFFNVADVWFFEYGGSGKRVTKK